MSSAILYLAIVAIWAGFLVPAWIRRPHGSRSGSAAETELTTGFDADTEIDVESSVEADTEGGVHVEVSRHVQVSRHTEAVRYESTDRLGGAARHGDARQHAEARHADADRRIEISHSEPTRQVPVTHAGPGHSGQRSLEPEAEYPDEPDYPDNADRADSRAPTARPSQSREQMLRARRRMLTILVGLTFLAWGLAATGLAAWWLCVPPTGMLVLYVLLLREIAMAEAEMASRRRQAQTARVARQRSRQASAASQPEPTAQIIDISNRVGDQLYDQYADAAVRAVGD